MTPAPTVVAVDVGGTKILGAAFDGDVELARVEVPTPRAVDGRGDPGGAATLGVIDRLAEDSSVDAICIGVPEYVDRGRITSAEVLTWTPDTVATIEAAVASRVGARPVWESDVRCGALGEWHARTVRGDGDADRDVATVLFVSLGTGISHTLVVDGVAYEGENGRAIALGELRPGRDHPSVEVFCSGRGVLDRWTTTHGPIEPSDLFNPATDSTEAEFISSSADVLGWAIAQVTLVLDPGVVVLGGGLGCRDTLYRRLILDAVTDWVPDVRVSPSVAGPDAGLLGAAYRARHPFGDSSGAS